jgi:hypothetical protein
VIDSAYVPAATKSAVPPDAAAVRPAPIVRSGASRVPAFESEPVGDTWMTLTWGAT